MMKWVWGALITVSLAGLAFADTTHALRTPNGMLWANTTFTLQARARFGNLSSTSPTATVRVGQVVRWRTSSASPSGMTVPSGNALFGVVATNEGNGFDFLRLTPYQQELTDTIRWQVQLYENLTGSGQVSGSRLVANSGATGNGSPLAPGQSVQYLIQAVPPSSSTHTDGVWAGLGVSFSNPSVSPRWIGEFVAGVNRTAGVHSRAWSSGDHPTLVAPILYQGRLFWMGTNPSTQQTRIFYTASSIVEPNSSLNSNRQVYGRVLNAFVPTGFSVCVGESWFVGRGSTLVRVSLPAVLANNTTADPFQTVSLPSGVQARLNLQPFVYNHRLYVVGTDNRLHVIRADGTWASQSARPSATVGNISCSPLLAGSSIYVGTQAGWILRFDLLTGAIAYSRQVGNQPIRSLQMTQDGRYLLVQLGDTRLLGLMTQNLSTYWHLNMSSPIVSPLAYDGETNTLLLFTQDGTLHALNAHTGGTRPYYPQRLWTGEPFQRATLAVVRQQERKASYVYLVAQQQVGSGSQARLMMVTLQNPYNRYQMTTSSGEECLPNLLFTGNQSHSFCLVTTKQTTSAQGFISAYQLR